MTIADMGYRIYLTEQDPDYVNQVCSRCGERINTWMAEVILPGKRGRMRFHQSCLKKSFIELEQSNNGGAEFRIIFTEEPIM